MSEKLQTQADIDPSSNGNFSEIRGEIAHKLFYDPSYRVFNAMEEMSSATENFIHILAEKYPDTVLWVGGSLGRREMLPNSDIDLFAVYDDIDQKPDDIYIQGVDKFELGNIDIESLNQLLTCSLVDANRFIDGRSVGVRPATEVELIMERINTSDRQLANNISEYFYYRYFDFPQKTTENGPNLKYSTGSTRDTIFFNMISRMSSDVFPARRGVQPELVEVLQASEEHYGVKAPYEAIDLLFIAKNAAISVYDKTGDIRSRYVSSISLVAIYEFCEDKFKARGIASADEFIDAYKAARLELELAVDTLFTAALSEHPIAETFDALLKLPKEEIPAASLKAIENESGYPHSVASFASWFTLISNPTGKDMDKLSSVLTSKPLNESWGGIMAVACAPATENETLSQLADWLYENEKGAYLLKLITRNPASSAETKAKALAYYKNKEIIT